VIGYSKILEEDYNENWMRKGKRYWALFSRVPHE